MRGAFARGLGGASRLTHSDAHSYRSGGFARSVSALAASRQRRSREVYAHKAARSTQHAGAGAGQARREGGRQAVRQAGVGRTTRTGWALRRSHKVYAHKAGLLAERRAQGHAFRRSPEQLNPACLVYRGEAELGRTPLKGFETWLVSRGCRSAVTVLPAAGRPSNRPVCVMCHLANTKQRYQASPRTLAAGKTSRIAFVRAQPRKYGVGRFGWLHITHVGGVSCTTSDAITPSRHHAITPSRHHAITPSHHHTITPSRHHDIRGSGRSSAACLYAHKPLSKWLIRGDPATNLLKIKFDKVEFGNLLRSEKIGSRNRRGNSTEGRGREKYDRYASRRGFP